MLYMPGILPCISFGVIHSAILGTAHCAGVEGIEPFAVTLAGAHETDTLVKEVLVIVGTLGKVGLILLLSHLFGHGVCGIVVIDAFERHTHALMLHYVSGEIAILGVGFPVRLWLVRDGLGFLDRLPCLFHVKSAESLGIGFSHNGHAVVANHTVVVLAPQSPDGQISKCLVMQEHTAHKGIYHFGQHQGIEWMRGSVGVPGREGAVIGSTLCLSQFALGVTVHAIHVGNVVGLDERMIITGIEVGLLLVCSLHLNA